MHGPQFLLSFLKPLSLKLRQGIWFEGAGEKKKKSHAYNLIFVHFKAQLYNMLEFPQGFVNTRLNPSQVLVCHPKTRKYYLFSAGFNPFVFEILQVTGSPQGNLSYFNRHECVSSVRISVFLKFRFLRCCQPLDRHSLEKPIPSASF